MQKTPAVLGCALVALALGGCSGGTAGSTPAISNPQSAIFSATNPRAPRIEPGPAGMPAAWMRPVPAVTSPGRLYASEFNLTVVNEYPSADRKNVPPLCQVTNQPYVNGIGVDSAQNLWVPQGAIFSGTTTEFAPNCGKVLLSIPDTNGQPGAIAFDAKHRVFVLNMMSSNGPGNIDVYPPGATKPSTVLTDTKAFRWFDVAIDRGGNAFAIYADPYNKGHVIEFVHGKNPVADLPMTLGFPGGITFDSAGNLLVMDQDAVNVSVYAPPFTGSPIATFRLQADSVPCRFNAHGTLLYCADFTHASVDVYGYQATNPKATAYLYSITKGIAPQSANAGVALAPAFVP